MIPTHLSKKIYNSISLLANNLTYTNSVYGKLNKLGSDFSQTLTKFHPPQENKNLAKPQEVGDKNNQLLSSERFGGLDGERARKFPEMI